MKIFKVLLIGLVCIGLCACGTKYEDTNGENNYNLQTITDENIINLDVGASNLGYKESNIMGITSSEYYSKDFNGVEQLYLTDYILESDPILTVNYINVKSGNFKFVVILDDEIIKVIPNDAFAQTYYFEDIKGTFSIHVAGESANVEFDFYVE